MEDCKYTLSEVRAMMKACEEAGVIDADIDKLFDRFMYEYNNDFVDINQMTIDGKIQNVANYLDYTYDGANQPNVIVMPDSMETFSEHFNTEKFEKINADNYGTSSAKEDELEI